MDEAGVARWLDDYVAAWRSYDAAAIGALFSDDAVYRWHPWDEGDEATHGREAIVASWLETPDAPGSWDAEAEAVFHNIFLLRFDDDGRCAEFTDVYMRRPE